MICSPCWGSVAVATDSAPGRHASLEQWLRWLESLHPQTIDLGLERLRPVYQRLALNPQRAKVLTIAGTNGKGSCALVSECLAMTRGLTTGCYTSPHLWRYNERIRIDGQEADDAQIIAAFCAVEACRQGVSLSYFEFGTLAALWLFDQAGLELWILEVGLGGRLDAVNIVDSDVAVVTSIALDHQAWLGDKLDDIAKEKAAIARASRTLLLGADVPEAALELARQIGAVVSRIDGELENIVIPVHLAGINMQNIALAQHALLALGCSVSDQDVTQALANLQLPARCQIRQMGHCEEVVDVAHNEAAVHHLASFVSKLAPKAPTAAVFSALNDKPVADMVRVMAPLFDFWCIAELGMARGLSLDELDAALCEQQDVRKFADIPGARAHALQHAARIVTFGSFYTVAQAGRTLHG